MTPYQRLRAGVMLCLRWLLAALFGAMVAVSFAQVIWRYVLNNSLVWSEELARYLFVWSVFVGAAVGYERGAHLALDLLTARLSPPVQRWLKLVSDLAILGLSVYLIRYGANLVQLTLDDPSPAMQISVGLVYLAIPVGSALTAWFALEKLVKGVMGK